MKKHLKNVVRKDNIEDKTLYSIVLTQNERNHPLPQEMFYSFTRSITQKDIFFYPNLTRLKEKLTKYFNTSNFLLTPGSDTAIKTFFELFDLTGKNIVTTDYSFPMYKVYADLYNTKVRAVKYKSMKIDVDKIINKVNKDTAFIILANPNSPLGDYIEVREIKRLLKLNIPVLIDEAYIECTSNISCIELLKAHSNLFITRTFSKGFGAAGLRVGVILCNKKYIDILNKFRFMYEISSISAKYCEFIIDNIEYFREYLHNLLDNKKKLVKNLKTQYTILDTDTTWFFLQDDSAKSFERLLDDNKISCKKLKLPISSNNEYYKVNYDMDLNTVLLK